MFFSLKITEFNPLLYYTWVEGELDYLLWKEHLGVETI